MDGLSVALVSDELCCRRSWGFAARAGTSPAGRAVYRCVENPSRDVTAIPRAESSGMFDPRRTHIISARKISVPIMARHRELGLLAIALCTAMVTAQPGACTSPWWCRQR